MEAKPALNDSFTLFLDASFLYSTLSFPRSFCRIGKISKIFEEQGISHWLWKLPRALCGRRYGVARVGISALSALIVAVLQWLRKSSVRREVPFAASESQFHPLNVRVFIHFLFLSFSFSFFLSPSLSFFLLLFLSFSFFQSVKKEFLKGKRTSQKSLT